MAIQHRSADVNDNAGGGTSVTATLPSAAVAGDRIVLGVTWRADDPSAATPPAGLTWTEILPETNHAGPSPDLKLQAWEAIADGGETAFQVDLSVSSKAVAGVVAFYDDGGDTMELDVDAIEDSGAFQTNHTISTGARADGDEYILGLHCVSNIPGATEAGDLANDDVDQTTGGANSSRNRLTLAHLITSGDSTSKANTYTYGSNANGLTYIAAYRAVAGGGGTTLNGTPIATSLAIPTPALALSLDLAGSPIAADLVVPASAPDLSLVLSGSPIPAALAVPSSALNLSIELAATPIAAVLAVPISSIVGSGGPITLEGTPIAVALATPGSTLDMVLGLSGTPIVATLATPGGALDTSVTIVATPIPAELALPGGALDLSNTLALIPIAAQVDVPAGAFGLVTTLQGVPIAVQLAITEGDLGGGDIVTGSDVQFVMDCIAFWIAYDEADNETAKRQLYREFLLTHGGRLVYDRGFWTIVGAAEPVRIDL